MKVPVAIINREGELVASNPSWDEFLPFYNHNGNIMMTLHDLYRSPTVQKSVGDVWNNERELIEYNFRTLNRIHHVFTISNWNQKDGNYLFLQVRESEQTDQVEENAMDILESMTDSFFSLDANWCFTYLNAEAEKLLNRKRESLLGENMWDEFPGSRGSDFERFYTKTMMERVTTHFEEYYQPLETWFEIRAYPNKQGGISVYFKNNNITKELEHSLWKAANTDFLSTLPNRRFAYDKMKSHIDNNESFSLFFLDLNQFKVINDLYGHDVGDQLIKLVGERLLDELPEQYDVARLGGDEYLVIVKESGFEDKIKEIGNRIIRTFSEPFKIDYFPDIYIDPSVGVSQFPLDGMNVDTLIDKADIAMYEAKNNRVTEAVIYDPSMHETISRDLIIQQELKKVIERNELTFVYQPQVDSRTDWVTGVEVLSRWNHPVLGQVSPAAFIPIAESSGMIEKITRFQISTCLHEYVNWIQNYHFKGTIAFNISSSLFPSKSFITFFTEIIESLGIAYEKIEVEITENIKLFSNKESIKNLAYLRELGVRIAIDDFGTGYSTLSYLYDFPVDKVKIDKLFIDQINQDPRGEAILVSIIKLARSLHLDLIAEGVETKQQVDFLTNHNCIAVQGYYYYRPMTIQECEEFYHRIVLKQ